MRPKVSVIMPVLNGERYIDEAIESIIAQTYQNCELVLVDDGSTDSTYERVKRFLPKLAIRYVRHESPRGIAASMNDGVRNATGDMISFLDHDDTWLPEFLEAQVSYLEQHPDVGMVHSDFRTIDPDGNVLEESVARCRQRKRPSGSVFRELFLDSFIVGNSVLIRKECFERLGMFEESFRWGDYHMWLRIARHYRVDYVDKVLTSYRQHPTQSTRTVATSRPDQDSVAMQAIDKLLTANPDIRSELGDALIRRRRAALYFDLAYSWHLAGDFRSARVCLRRAIAVHPFDLRFYVLYAACLLPQSQTAALRTAWRRIRGRHSLGRTAAEQARTIRTTTI
jgi:glycosyltransferase involved in cell wall biosynthesis